MEINQKNDANQLHGYCEKYYEFRNKELWSKCHWLNDKAYGYYVSFYDDGEVRYKCHYEKGKEIGCEIFNKYQYFYKTSNKKFGEQIRWK